MKKKILSFLSILFFNGCQSSIIKVEERIMINSNEIILKYLNTNREEVDTVCINKKVINLFDAIENNQTSVSKSIFFIEHKYYKKLSVKEALIIEDIKKSRFIFLPFDKSFFFLSKKPFDKKNDESFLMYQLLKETDLKKCVNVSS